MQIKKEIKFLDNISAPVNTGMVYDNIVCDILSLETKGTATDYIVKVQGCNSLDCDEWYDVAAINTKDFTIGDITKNGIYEIGIESVRKVRVVCTALSSGTLTANGLLICTAI